jgi:hypothetical protein
MYRDNDQREFIRVLRNQLTNAEKRLWHLLPAARGFHITRFRNEEPDENIPGAWTRLDGRLMNCRHAVRLTPPQPSPSRGGSRTIVK